MADYLRPSDTVFRGGGSRRGRGGSFARPNLMQSLREREATGGRRAARRTSRPGVAGTADGAGAWPARTAGARLRVVKAAFVRRTRGPCESSITAIVFDPVGALIAVGDASGLVHVFDFDEYLVTRVTGRQGQSATVEPQPPATAPLLSIDCGISSRVSIAAVRQRGRG